MSNDCNIQCPDDPIEEFKGSGYTWAKLRAIEDAIATGARLVRINNRTTEFHSIDQLIKAKNDIRRELEAQEALKNPCRRKSRAFRMRVF